MRIYRSFTLLFLFFALSSLSAKDFNIVEFGAIGDNKTINTEAIQEAIDIVNSEGGGRVIIPAGTFCTGTLILKNNVTLHLEEGATLKGSTDLKDYPEIIPKYRSFTDHYVTRSMVYAENQENISLTGKGTIEGNGGAPEFTESPSSRDKDRPFVLRIISSRDIIIRDLTFRNSAKWMQHYLNCDYLQIDGIKVFNHVNRNNDGLDIDGCRNVIISNCIIDSEDDALCLKSSGPDACEFITIDNCILRSNCNAFKMGTESIGGFRNITVNNLVIDSCQIPSPYGYKAMNHTGIVILSVDGAEVENISINNVVMNGVQASIFIKLGNRLRSFDEKIPSRGPGYLRNISISNVIAHDADTETLHISGFPGHYVENVSLDNIQFFCYGGGKEDHIWQEVPEREAEYPDIHHYAEWYPAYGIFARHIDGLNLKDLEFYYDLPEERPVLFGDDLNNLQIFDLKAQSEPGMKQLFYLRNTKNAYFIQNIRGEGAKYYLNIAGESENIILDGIIGLGNEEILGNPGSVIVK